MACRKGEELECGNGAMRGERGRRRLTLGAIIGREDANEAPIFLSVSGFFSLVSFFFTFFLFAGLFRGSKLELWSSIVVLGRQLIETDRRLCVSFAGRRFGEEGGKMSMASDVERKGGVLL